METTDAKQKGGIRGKVAEKQKGGFVGLYERSIEKIQTYVPPENRNKIQQVYGAGKVSIQILEPNKKVKLSFPDYNEPEICFLFQLTRQC